MKRIQIALSLGALGIAAAVAIVVPQSCGARTPRVVKMKVGETIVVTPVPVQNLTSQLPEAPPKKLLLRFMSGGKEVSPKSGSEIHFFEKQDSAEAFYVMRAEDFPNLHLKTKCASSDVSLLDNAVESDVLICDGSLDVHKANKIELRSPNGKVKTATSVVPESVENDLFNGSVTFF
ncbi:MAG: hypothetical protein RI953_1116 [Pseudomonadota bacterium]|jgi:hypothetical protein